MLEQTDLPFDLYNKQEDELRSQAQSELHLHFQPLTRGQRCAYLFILRIFRLRAISALEIYFTDPSIHENLNLAPPNNTNTPEEWLIYLAKGWFSHFRVTEEMKWGSLNQPSVFRSLSTLSIVIRIFDCNLFCRREESSFACSPDGTVSLDLHAHTVSSSWYYLKSGCTS